MTHAVHIHHHRCTNVSLRPDYFKRVFPLQLFALLGFVVSAVLISAAASEVVSLLHMLGVVLRLSNTVLGLTLLAWGNSIGGDYAYGMFVSRINFPPKHIELEHFALGGRCVCQ